MREIPLDLNEVYALIGELYVVNFKLTQELKVKDREIELFIEREKQRERELDKSDSL